MTEFYARKDYIYDGGDRIFTIPFDYIELRHIRVFINDTQSASFYGLNDSQIQIADWVELNAGDTVSIRRITPIYEQMVIFSDKSILNEDTQNLAQKQMFNAVQELYDSNTKFIADTNTTLETNRQEVMDYVEGVETQLQTAMETADNNIQSQLDDFEDTVNLTAERLSLIESYVVSSANSAETAIQAATNAQNALSSAQTASTTAVNAAESASDTLTELNTNAAQALTDITTAKTNSLSEIDSSKTQAISAIANSKSEALSNITTTKSQSVSDITTAKNQALAEIVQASLPTTDALSNYYTKYETNSLLQNIYDKSEVDTALDNYYTISDINANYYTKSQIELRLGDIEDLLDLVNGEVI